MTSNNTVTPELLRAVVPTLSLARRRLYAPLIQAAAIEFDITNEARFAAFLAQTAEESDHFNTLVEYASGAAYEGRYDLGNTQPGDGRRYKGRGAIQLTGRANYRRAGRALGLPLEEQPALAAEPEVAFRIAGWFWKTHGLNELADARRFEEITRRINGGYNGLTTRIYYYGRALDAISDDFRLTANAPDPDPDAAPDVHPTAMQPSAPEESGGSQPVAAAPAPPDAQATAQRVNASAQQPGLPEQIERVQQTWGSKLTAWWPMVSAPLLGVWASFQALPPVARALLVTGLVLGGLAIGAWLWNESKRRQQATQHALIDAAADPAKNTVTIAPPPAKAG